MAKKRLNKKVALIGSVVFLFLVLGAILLFLNWGRDPEKFVKDGDAALLAEDYERAERNYLKARSLAKDDSLRIEMLFKLVDMYIKIDRWRDALGCWNAIVKIDSKNVKARLGRLRYHHLVADSGFARLWQEVASQASEFIEVVEDAGLLMEDTAKWESFEIREKEVVAEQLGPYLYLIRGRATLEMAKRGAVTNRDESLAQAVDDLKKAQELAPSNPQAYWYLAQAVITRGEILAERGNLEEREVAQDSALELLEQAVEVAGADATAHINLLTMKLAMSDREQIQSLEPEYLSLVERFPSKARAYSALAKFYWLLGPNNLDKAIEAIEKATELDKENVEYAINAAELHYRRFSIYGQKPDIYKAIEVAKNALTSPDAQDKGGPRQWANRMNRVSLYAFLANCYIEQVLEPCDPELGTQEWLTAAEQAVHEIEQVLGSGEEPQVVKWQGMLELAKGNRNIAIKKLYAAYEQLKASGRKDSILSYQLAKVFEGTNELGAAKEFFISALTDPGGIDERRPEALLDYADVLLRLKTYNAYVEALSVVTFFENKYWANDRTRRTRISAYIRAGQFDEVEKELAEAEPDDPNTIKLKVALVQAKIEQVQRAIVRKEAQQGLDTIVQGLSGAEEEGADELETIELKGYWDALAGLVQKLLEKDADSVEDVSIAVVCSYYIAEGKTSQAKDLVNQFLGYFPDNKTALFYKQMLSEPDPGKISQQRREEIEEQVLSNITDPIRRAVNLGVFYQRCNELNKAAGEFKKALKIEAPQEGVVEVPAFEESKEIADSQHLAVSYLFEIALGTKDWELASAMVDVAHRENLDGCGGQFFAARIAMAKEQYQDALASLEDCLRQRPVFSLAFMIKAKVNGALGNERASIEDAQKAASLNPRDQNIAKELANALYQRDLKLGDNVLVEQKVETRAALDRAVALNPGDLQLLSFYAEYVSSTEPVRALAIRQNLQKNAPSVENAVLLGRMATTMAVRETEAVRKEALFDIAASSFEQAKAIEPQNQAMLDAQAEYYRARGLKKKAEQLLLESQNQKLLWNHYLQSGQFEQARRVLAQLYKKDDKDSDVVNGLLLIAEKAADKESVKKYSEELLVLEDSVESHLIQIQAFLKVDLIKEAEYKLQSFRERYPDERRAMLLEAWLAMRQGQLKKALELTNQNLQTNQDSAMAWRLRGEINYLMVNYDHAIIDLERSRSLLDEPVTRVALAKAYVRAGREGDAIIELKNAINDPQAPMEGGILLEEIYSQLGRRETLRRFYDEILEKFPDNVLWYNRAAAFAIVEGDFGRAEQLYKTAFDNSVEKIGAEKLNAKRYRLNAIDALDGYLRALLLSAGTPAAKRGGFWDTEKLNKVLEEGEKYVDTDFAPIAFFRMADAKMKLGDKASAVQYCRKALKTAGTDEIFTTEILRGMYLLLGADEVSKYCKERLETDPDSLAANLTMFNLAKINAEYEGSIGYIDKCIEIIDPTNRRRDDCIVKKAEVLRLTYYQTSDKIYLKKAITEYESLLAKMPNNTGILNNLAYMLAESDERLAEALEYVERAIGKQPDNPNFLDTYAYVLHKNGRNLEAAESLQAALQQYEQNKISAPAEAYEHLGMIKEEAGARDDALAAYKQALVIMSASETALKIVRERVTVAIERLSGPRQE